MAYDTGALWCAKRGRHHYILGRLTCTDCDHAPRTTADAEDADDRYSATHDLALEQQRADLEACDAMSDNERDLIAHRPEG